MPLQKAFMNIDQSGSVPNAKARSIFLLLRSQFYAMWIKKRQNSEYSVNARNQYEYWWLRTITIIQYYIFISFFFFVIYVLSLHLAFYLVFAFLIIASDDKRINSHNHNIIRLPCCACYSVSAHNAHSHTIIHSFHPRANDNLHSFHVKLMREQFPPGKPTTSS